MARVAAALLALALAVQEPSAEWTERIECGPLVLEVRASRTAHLFHVVDQLSAWSEFCHAQYGRAMPLDDADRAALERHKAIRGRRGWGGGLEQAFYTPAPLEEALAAGVKAEYLDDAQAATEREVFARFEARVDALLRAQSADLRKSLAALDRESVTRMAKQLGRLFAVERVEIPVYLMASPPPGSGGGFSGGRITIELEPGQDAAPTLVHEATHAFIERKRAALEECVKRTEGLDYQTLNEGIAYAVMPGLFSAGKEDRLAAQVARDLARGAGLDDAYVRFNRYGLALRPAVKEALEDGDLAALLDRAGAVWKKMRDEAESNRAPRSLCAGPGWEAFTERMKSVRPEFGRWSFNHGAAEYDRWFRHLKERDLVVLTFSGDSRDRAVPDAHRDLLPLPLDEVWKAVAAGGTVEKAATIRGARVVLLAAPTKEALARLVRESKSLAE
jgi:hypothetical protein